MERKDVTIIGGGPVGLFAAFYAGLRDMSVRIIDSLPDLGGQLTALYPEKFVYDMPGFPKVLARDLAEAMIEQAMRFHPQCLTEQTCNTLTPDEEGYIIGTDRGLECPTRTVIISAGAGAFSPTKMGVPQEDDWVGRGVSYGVKTKAEYIDKKVLVVGGGDSAFDWALNLIDVAESVTIVHRRDEFRAHEESVRQAHDAGIGFKLWQVVSELHGNGVLTGVTLKDTRTQQEEKFAADAVVVNIGFKSTLGPIKDWGFEIVKNQIVVDDLYRTSLPGVFAVGDVCAFQGKLKLIATGVGEAATAVCFAKTHIDPAAKLFPGHSSELAL